MYGKMVGILDESRTILYSTTDHDEEIPPSILRENATICTGGRQVNVCKNKNCCHENKRCRSVSTASSSVTKLLVLFQYFERNMKIVEQ